MTFFVKRSTTSSENTLENGGFLPLFSMICINLPNYWTVVNIPAFPAVLFKKFAILFVDVPLVIPRL